MFEEHIPLGIHASYRIGGTARYFFEATSEGDLREALREAAKLKTPVCILGGGTNFLFPDEEWDGLVIKIAISDIHEEDGLVSAAAGTSIAELLEWSAVNRRTGLEWAGGLPGTVGGAVRGNAGAFGGEMKDSIVKVTAMNTKTLETRLINTNECGFGYRTSIFKEAEGTWIILRAAFRLLPGDESAIRSAIDEKVVYRLTRQPLEYPNAGSVFKNVPFVKFKKENATVVAHKVKQDPFPVVPTAHLIGEAGLAGVTCGGAMISPKHTNFIVNVCDASANDVKALLALAKHEVKQKFDVDLEEEIQILA